MTDGSRAAIQQLTRWLHVEPDNLAARWLLNLSHMTLGEFPDAVPEKWRLPDRLFAQIDGVPRFVNVASQLGVDTCKLSGGVILEDFDTATCRIK